MKELGYNINDGFLIHFELTNKCQAACPCCARNTNGVVLPWLDKHELYLEDVQKIMEGSALLGSANILYCGNYGDPGFARDLIPIVKWFHKETTSWNNNRYQTINTNGGMRDPDFWYELGTCLRKEERKGRVTFSIDGLEDTNHIYRRGVIWEKLWRNLNAYIESGGAARWEFLVFGHNKHQVEEARRIAESLGMEFVAKRPFGFDLSAGQLDSNRYIHTYTKKSQYEYSITSADDELPGPVRLEEMKSMTYDTPKEKPVKPNIIATDKEISFSAESNINCKSLGYDMAKFNSGQDVYIRSDGHLLPCCFMDGVTYNAPYNFASQQIQETIFSVYDHLNVLDNNLDDVIISNTVKKAFFEPMTKDSVEQGKPLFCIDHCGAKAPMDLLYRKYKRD